MGSTFLRRVLLWSFVAYLHCLAASAQMWPGQTPALGWGQFDNGAYFAVTGQDDIGTIIEFFDGNEAQISYLQGTAAPSIPGPASAPTYTPPTPANGNSAPAAANSTGTPSISGPQHDTWAGSVNVGSLARRFAILAALWPDRAGDGTADSLWDQCEFANYRGNWANPPCRYNTTIPQYYVPGENAPLEGGTNMLDPSYLYRHIDNYPDRSNPVLTATIWQSTQPVFPPNFDELPYYDELTEAERDGLNGTVDITDPSSIPDEVSPAIFEPVPLPEGVPQLPADVMNPNGYPADGEDIVANPVAWPSPTPWPSNDPAEAWPADHPAPGAAPSPSAVPSGGTNTGTNPGTDPASGGSTTVNVQFPDNMDVTVQNWPETTLAMLDDDGSEPDEQEVDIGGLTWESGWLPNSCPEPLTIEFFGASVSMPYDNICAVAQALGPIIIIMTLLGAARFIFAGGE